MDKSGEWLGVPDVHCPSAPHLRGPIIQDKYSTINFHSFPAEGSNVSCCNKLKNFQQLEMMKCLKEGVPLVIHTKVLQELAAALRVENTEINDLILSDRVVNGSTKCQVSVTS